MEIVLLIVVVGLAGMLLYQRLRAKKVPPQDTSDISDETLPVKGAYQKRWLFSYNEKDAYRKLKEAADKYGYVVFAKVRLLDLLEPVKGTPKYRTYFYKIQAKHVDFVLCDAKLVVRHIIELDDGSHDHAARRQRDSFVDEAVQSVGYSILHIRSVTEDIEKWIRPSAEQEKSPQLQ